MKHRNDLSNIPAAACGVCGGWTRSGGMSQHSEADKPVMGRTGCTGPHNMSRARYVQMLDEIDAEGERLARAIVEILREDC